MLVLPITMFLLFGSTLGQGNLIQYTQNISRWPQPLESNFPPIRVVVTVFLEEIAQPGLFTLSGLSKATTLEASRNGSCAASSNSSSPPVFRSQPYSQSIFRACSLSNATACRHSESPFRSTSPASNSRTMLTEFTGAAAQSKLKKVYFGLFFMVCFQILRIHIYMNLLFQ